MEHILKITPIPTRRTPSGCWMRLAIGLLFGGSLMAQTLSVSISPPSASLYTGVQQQFTITASNFTPTGVTWWVDGQLNGNKTNGTITQNGLYTAPAAVPSTNPATVTVIATDSSGKSHVATATVTISVPTPVVLSVSPNPLPPGSQTVTITGTGFTATGDYIWENGVQYGATLNAAGQLTTGVYNAASVTSATFSIRSAVGMSNSVTIPVGTSGQPAYSLTVNSGSGSGTYAAGTLVTITANPAPSGQTFSNWDGGGGGVASPTSSTTTLTMPAANTTVTAKYTSTTAASYTLTVVGGTGSGSYAAGTVVTITATVPSGEVFSNWSATPSSANVANASASPTTITMPAANTTVTASFTTPTPVITSVSPNPLPLGTQTVTVTGTGFVNGSLIWENGAQLPSTLNAAGNQLTASVWDGSGTTSAAFLVRNPGNIFSNTVTVPMAGYTLNVVNGTGSGTYSPGTVVTITANAPPSGQVFLNWTGVTVANASAATTTITMTSSVTVTANFAVGPLYTLTVVNGQGSGNYVAGATVTITANAPPAGSSFLAWTGATVASTTASTTTLTMPAANTTVTATYSYTLTVINGTGSGQYAAGAVVPITANAAPSGEYFQQWTGPGIANANQPSTAVTMPATNTTVAAGYYTPTPVPFPVSAHPRLWITPSDLPRLRSWATTSNATYVGLETVIAQAVADYQSAFPGAPLTAKNPTPANPFPDFGDTQGYTGILVEQDGMLLAFQSLIDPSPSNRIAYAQAARNLIMYGLNQAALGVLAGAPFRDPQFPGYNRASATGHQWALVVDWIYNTLDAQNNPILTAADKAVIQRAFMLWSSELEVASTTGGDNPQSINVVNNLSLLPNNLPYRYASNNYYLAHSRNMTMMALALDPADDPPANPQLPSSSIGNTARSYILDANGAWLYQIWAMMGEPAQVAAAYEVPNNPTGAGFGLASGGSLPEGNLYGESFGYLLMQLLALETAGFNDPSISGPQIAMIGSPVWDRFVHGYISSLIPQPFVPPSEPYLGPIYQFAGYGDMLRGYVEPNDIMSFAMLTFLEGENGGQTTHQSIARWFAVNVPAGGAAGLPSRITTWTWGPQFALIYFMLLDPTVGPQPDPRPSWPTLFYDAPQGRIVAHSDWTPMGSMFDYKATWISINHQQDTGGQFELFRKGEWLTKEMSNYDNNLQGEDTLFHNTLAIQNWSPAGTPATLNWFEVNEWTNGSQWQLGLNAGDPTTTMSSGAGYVYGFSDITNLFNRPSVFTPNNAAMDVQQATRDIVWLSNAGGSDYIVTYDRATTGHNGFKRYNLCLVTAPVTTPGPNGSKVATETMADGQQLFIQTLLPMNPATGYVNGPSQLNPVADLEPTQWVYTVQDPSNPLTTRFLHVLQGADAGASMVAATYVASTSGTPFDGAVFGANAVFFPVSTTTPFGGATFTVPSQVTIVRVAGLRPNTAYSATVQAGVGGTTIVIGTSGPSAATTDTAGVLTVNF
jgi:Divergent InlB B-repeat domain